jgi:arginine N-succinyltransferase
MLLIRPVATNDHAEILELAHEAGIGFTSLPPDAKVLERKIARSVNSFKSKPQTEGGENFLFVLVDTDSGKLVGTTGIVTHVGLKRPFYSYKLSTIVQASAELDIYSQQRVLHMVNDYTGATEIGSLFLLPAYRRDGIGKFLSRSRYLMLAEFPQVFSRTVISEIRGVQDEHGNSPFYKHLAQHFFQMDFKRADFTNATKGGQFISDLMPKYPIYVNLLDKSAQDVIGQPLEASRPAVQMLEQEGFRYQGYIDVFDAGPTMQAELTQIRSVRKSHHAVVDDIKPLAKRANSIISSTRFSDFSIALAAVEGQDGHVSITPEAAKALGVVVGDFVRYVET